MAELVEFHHSASPVVNLICFHFAGGGANYFRSWSNFISESVGLYALRLPGRETLFSQPPLTSVVEVLQSIKSVLFPILSSPTPSLLFGHSMGSLIAFEVARSWSYLSRIKGLYISGFGHPEHIAKQSRQTLSNTEIIHHARNQNRRMHSYFDELLEIMLPTIRSDYAICDSYSFPKNAKLDIPITAFGGNEDTVHHKAAINSWESATTKQFMSYFYPGGHFFIDDYQQDIIRTIERWSVLI